jgi:hypothetical protein
MGTGGCLPGVKLTTHLHLAPRSRMVELYLHSPIHLHDVVLNWLSTGTTLRFLPLPDHLYKNWKGSGYAHRFGSPERWDREFIYLLLEVWIPTGLQSSTVLRRTRVHISNRRSTALTGLSYCSVSSGHFWGKRVMTPSFHIPPNSSFTNYPINWLYEQNLSLIKVSLFLMFPRSLFDNDAKN